VNLFGFFTHGKGQTPNPPYALLSFILSSPLFPFFFPALLHIDPKQIHFRFQLQYISLIRTSPLISRLNLTLVWWRPSHRVNHPREKERERERERERGQ